MPTQTRPARSSKPKGVRLLSVTRELGVSSNALVETLREKGFKLDEKLAAGDVNARLDEAMYDALIESHADDARVKAHLQERRAQMETEREVEAEESARLEAEAAAQAAAEAEAAKEAAAAARAEEARREAEAEAQRAREAEEAAREAAAKEAQAAATPTADAPAPDAAPEPTEAAEPVAAEAAADEAAAPEGEAPDSDMAGVVRADRYTLTGTTVLGKIDLSGLDGSGRRKRKRKDGGADEPAAAAIPPSKAAAKKAAAEAAADPNAPATAPPSEEGDDRGRRKRGAKGKGRTEVDPTEVEQKVQETRKVLDRGVGRSRQKRRRARRDERAAERQAENLRQEEMASTLRLMEFISTGELADAMQVPVAEVISKGFALGMMVSINQRLDADTITVFADEFGFDVDFMSDVEDERMLIKEDAADDLEPRSPVVTIMGHVDHGKTSLLDYIRSANVVAGEAGGITQHIGAYEVELEDERTITFLDTPGHEAFTAMRARGAQVTDLVILVVAADDQVMPQTIEAINHARAAEVPIVVAINKIDRPQANPDKIMQQLADQGVLVEQFGGKVQAELISALKGQNVDTLLEKVLIEAELLDLKANPDRRAVGTVIESRLDKGRGVVATVLVQTGTLRVGDVFVAGTQSGRVRAMFDERDNRVDEAGPSQPVALLGWTGAPEVGDRLVVMEDDREARDVASKRVQLIRQQTMHQRRHVSLEDLGRRMALGELTTLNLVVKGDVGGSVEALSDALLKISHEEVAVDIVHAGVGAITESDVMLAAASDAVIIGFQVRPVVGVRQLAEREEIDIRMYSVIYDAIAEVRDALEGLLSPEKTEEIRGTIEVRDTFRAPRVGTIAGSYVLDGKVSRNDRVRLIRDGVVVYNGEISSLRRFKDDVREVAAGYECGVSIQGFNDIKVGDQIESYIVVESKRKLTA